MPAKKYAIWAVVACAVLYRVKSPASAALNVRHAASGLAVMANSLSVFVKELASS